MTLTEAFGALSTALFVPSAVIEGQRANDAMLQAKAEQLNGSPNILALVTTDPKANDTLQAMNRDVFLSSQRDREAGEAVLNAMYDSIEEIPKNIKAAATAAGSTVGATLGGAIPVWLRWLLGLVAVAAIVYFIAPLFRRAAA